MGHYSGKFSKKTYTQYQHAAAICLMKYERKHYREIVDLLIEFSGYFGFREGVPHYTILQKFFSRIPERIWGFILEKTYLLFEIGTANVGIDSTGFAERHSSSYYQERILKLWKYNRFMKHSICVDTDNQLILSSINSEQPRNDTLYFKPLLKLSSQIVKINNITADRGYDSEENHEFARDEIGGTSVIPLRHPVSVWRTSGRYRK